LNRPLLDREPVAEQDGSGPEGDRESLSTASTTSRRRATTKRRRNWRGNAPSASSGQTRP